jgi:predicted aspartyl protease
VLNVSPTGVPLVTLTVNGGAAHLLLDTGAERTTLTEAAARRLGLLTDFDHAQTMRGVGGNVAAGEVKPDLVTGGGRKLPGLTFAVVPVTLPPVGEQEVDGLLGADMLSAYDLDIDLGHHLIKLYDPTTCPVPTLPWRRTFDEVQGQFSRHRHLAFPVTLDGHKLTAFIDTGAQISLIDAAAAGRMGVTEAALGLDEPLLMQGVSTQVVTAREHRFARLGIADGVLLAPVLGVTPLRLDDADLLLGTDVLRRQRIWLSYASRRIFVARPE